MKLFFIFFCCVSLSATAQINDIPVKLLHYALDSFALGKVKLKSGATSNQRLNYNLLTKEMIFDNNGTYLAVAHPEEVDTVVIGNRVFVPVDKGFYEVLWEGSYPLLVEHTCKIKEQGSQTGYGGNSNTTAATPLKSLLNDNGAYKLRLPDNFQLITGKSYYLYKNGKYNKTNGAQQFVKLFPEKEAEIKQWIESHHTNFSKQPDVIALVQNLQP